MEKDTSEIAKLAERIAKDPKSKLFVPLAEEHKKAGNIETAIQILTEGLKNNPSYVTARSFLGRLLMEQGDLAGARKELEEVIKAIPDNLLAQRKLGDIYVLQGSPADAAQRYKAALALNPGDKELPALIADIDAGRDVSARIPRPKMPVAAPAAKPAPAPTAAVPPKSPSVAAKPAVPAGPAAAVKAPAPTPQPQARPAPPAPATEAPAAVKPASPPPSPPSAAAQAKPQPSPAAPTAASVPLIDEAEVIEDLVDIETFDPSAASPESKAPAPGETAPAMPEVMSFDLSEAPLSEAEVVEEPMGSLWAADAPAAAVAQQSSATDEGADDLNTNTLAELYISQGFYDKALEIYQGMLNDKPGNKALQQKIGQLKEMAGEQEASSALRATPVTAGAREYTPPAEAVEATVVTAPEAATPAPAKRTAPAPAAPQAASERKPAVQEQPVSAHATPGAHAASARRQATIDRLESWLKNVAKEKP